MKLDVYNLPPVIRHVVRACQVSKALGPVGGIRSVLRAIAWPMARRRAELLCPVLDYELFLNRQDRGISRELFLYAVHEPITTNLIRKELAPGMNVVDVGGNIGYYPILEARSVGPRGKVLALEPYPPSAALLRKNVAANRLEEVVTVRKVAAGSEPGQATIFVSEMANWNSLIPFVDGQEALPVRVCRVDEICTLEPVHFVRMDIEGFETKAIAGMRRILEDQRPMLCMELHPHLVGPEPILGMLEELRGLGYGVKHAYPRKLDLIGLANSAPLDKVSWEQLLDRGGPIQMRTPYTVWLQ